MKTQKQIIQGLRDAIGFLRRSKFIPCSIELKEHDENRPIEMKFNLNSKEEIADFVRQFDFCEKEYIESFVYFKSQVTKNLLVTGFDYRSRVCTRKIVGTKRIERKVIPEQVIEAHDEEIIEWDCNSILSPEEVTESN